MFCLLRICIMGVSRYSLICWCYCYFETFFTFIFGKFSCFYKNVPLLLLYFTRKNFSFYQSLFIITYHITTRLFLQKRKTEYTKRYIYDSRPLLLIYTNILRLKSLFDCSFVYLNALTSGTTGLNCFFCVGQCFYRGRL